MQFLPPRRALSTIADDTVLLPSLPPSSPPPQAQFKSFSFLLFSGTCMGGALYVFFMLPETKGKTLLEISEEFSRIKVCGSPKKEEEEKMCSVGTKL